MTGRIETSRASSAQTINWKSRSDCEYGDQNFWAVPSSAVQPGPTAVRGPKHHDFWLANHWRIVEIGTTSALTVMNMCGREETLDVEGIPALVKGEPASATVPARAPSSASLPPHIVDHTQGMWGKVAQDPLR